MSGLLGSTRRVLRMRRVGISLAFSAAALASHAAGPKVIALSHRALWPESIDSAAAFDRASRAEILSFSAVLGEHSHDNAAALAAWLGLKGANPASVAKWRAETQARLAENFRRASAACDSGGFACAETKDGAGLQAAALRFAERLPDTHRRWFADAQQFHRLYAQELLRLAALFPRPTSEILQLDGNETAGWELPDREFLLSFDDGPTLRGGRSDATLAALKPLRLHGEFFLLGDALRARLRQEPAAQLRERYEGQCVASHGESHTSHQSRADWQASVIGSSALIRETFPAAYLPNFRPPYGQRKTDGGAFFRAQHLSVALWNIDSQDWNAHLSAAESSDRVLSLILLWRHGVILFHDVHDKAPVAVPKLAKALANSGLHWRDCRESPNGPEALDK